jgi:hypothetical protein
MENIKNIPLKNDNVLLSSIKEGKDCIYVIMIGNGSIQKYKIRPKVS